LLALLGPADRAGLVAAAAPFLPTTSTNSADGPLGLTTPFKSLLVLLVQAVGTASGRRLPKPPGGISPRPWWLGPA